MGRQYADYCWMFSKETNVGKQKRGQRHIKQEKKRVVSSRKKTARLLNIPRQIVSDAICRLKYIGNDSRRAGSWRKRTVNISKNHKAIEKRVQRNPRVSVRQITRDMGISDRSVRRIAKTELGLKPYKLRKFQLLIEKKANSYGSEDA
ncbi:uncharacterized protein TNCV_3011831 [Trichonephila clavipes]|nr:uncharacterized protein TNCV_3011831 [Trichonephila clavipes]